MGTNALLRADVADQQCATLKFPRVRRVAKDLKIKLQTKRDGKRDKPQLCEMIKRKVGVNRTPISVQIRKMVAPRKRKPLERPLPRRRSARKAAPKKKVIARKAAPKKKVIARKAAPKKKVIARKAAPKKKVVARKAAPKKKVIARKAAPKKPINLTTMFPSSTKTGTRSKAIRE